MITIGWLSVILFGLMVSIGGMNGARSFLSLFLNFLMLFFTIILITGGFPPVAVTLINGIIILAITIFLGDDNTQVTETAFYASLIVLIILVLLIIPVEHLAAVQGFGAEDSEEIEAFSLLVGANFMQIAISTAIFSTLGAIAEGAIAISAGLNKIVEQTPTIDLKKLYAAGISIGKHIIGTTFNTLFFGFFGGFLALFILLVQTHATFADIINDKIFVAELIMILFSIIGVILSVPITAWVLIQKLKKENN